MRCSLFALQLFLVSRSSEGGGRFSARALTLRTGKAHVQGHALVPSHLHCHSSQCGTSSLLILELQHRAKSHPQDKSPDGMQAGGLVDLRECKAVSDMPNVQLLDMEDVLHSDRIGCIGPDTGPESVCCQALQAAVSCHCVHEAPLQGVRRSVCLKSPAAPALRREKRLCVEITASLWEASIELPKGIARWQLRGTRKARQQRSRLSRAIICASARVRAFAATAGSATAHTLQACCQAGQPQPNLCTCCDTLAGRNVGLGALGLLLDQRGLLGGIKTSMAAKTT